MDTLNVLLHSPEFWASLWALVNVVLLYFVPTFPKDVQAAMNVLALVVFAAITGRTTPPAVVTYKAARTAKKE